MTLNDFYRGTTKIFSGTISLNGTIPDITSDIVTFVMKTKKTDSDEDALINEDADVTTNGAEGRYDFTFTKTATDVVIGGACYEIVWKRSGGAEYVLEQGNVTVLERVEDVEEA